LWIYFVAIANFHPGSAIKPMGFCIFKPAFCCHELIASKGNDLQISISLRESYGTI
jgi:hypothetical protein